uniref:Putative conserved secreted protein n=1 Tax=Hyalomma excavatum TaxID=257692 RepID=A0A131XCH0_9ACAR
MSAAEVLAFFLFFAASCIGNSTQHNRRWVLPRVGEGVTVRARVLFDHTVNFPNSSAEEESAKNKSNPTLEDFKKLFKKVEEGLHNISIKVNIIVENATMNDSLRAPYGSGESLDAKKTLTNLKMYAKTHSHSNDTIFYYFTKSEILEATRNGDEIPLQPTEKATFGTFCTEEVSAALVMLPDPDPRHIGILKATAEVFGLTKYKNLSWKDYIGLFMKFAQCPRNECWMKCLQQDAHKAGNETF